jgi:sugar phosphate isomerase/epimerase
MKILATNWGFTGTLEEYLRRVVQEGYDGIEMLWPSEKKEQQHLVSVLRNNKIETGFLCASFEKDWKEHLNSFKKLVDTALSSGLDLLYINCHSGRDFYLFEQNASFIEFTIEQSKQSGVLICHETHRSRLLFSAPTSREFLLAYPEMKITLDASHWCNVSESLLEDQADTMKLAIEKTGHIHARVGHAEGPQVNDPRAPEWKPAVDAHLNWWDQVVKRKKENNEPITFLAEFGPPDYMPTKPYSREPLSNQWEVNVHMMKLLRDRYGSK